MKKLILLLAASGIVAASCNKEPLEPSDYGKSAGIGVTVSDVNDLTTRSMSGEGALFDSFFVDYVEGQAMRIDAYVSDVCPQSDCVPEPTKGTIATTSGITSFTMDAYANGPWHDNEKADGEQGSITDPNPAGSYFSAKAVTKGSDSKWTIADAPKWLNEVELSFWSYVGATPVIPSGSTAHNAASFAYTNAGQTDLIFAYNQEKRKFDAGGNITDGSGTYNASYKDKMDIRFHHALAAVRFDVSGLKENGMNIKSVTISGVASKGNCNLAGTSDNKMTVTWPESGLSTPASFTQAYSASDFTETSLDGQTAAALMPMSSDKFFFFIPQKVKDKGMKIKITYTNAAGTDVDSEVSLNHDTQWEAGKYYTYKLNLGDVDLALTGTMPAASVKNTGSVKEYLRVAIVANWCLVDSATSTWYPLSECPSVPGSGDVTYTGFHNMADDNIAGAGGHWVRNDDDGYYYYTKAVDPGVEVTLFDGYAARTGAAHIDGTRLRLTVIGQAVAAGTATGWADAAKVQQ